MSPFPEVSYGALTAPQKELLDAALAATTNAHAPFSHFFVGAAVRMKSGRIIPGVNFECAAYGSTICAERSAIVSAYSQGFRDIVSCAVIATSQAGPVTEPVAPCGACRQVLVEASQMTGGDLELILSNSDQSRVIVTKIHELIPLSFGPASMGIKPYGAQ